MTTLVGKRVYGYVCYSMRVMLPDLSFSAVLVKVFTFFISGLVFLDFIPASYYDDDWLVLSWARDNYASSLLFF